MSLGFRRYMFDSFIFQMNNYFWS